ncbi:ATP-grasp domain-containing protein [Seinonella peptonophila]|nr:ATP-grasp domain-containing protein [Seinonella peptonophila]
MSILILNRTPISMTPYAKYLKQLSEPLLLLTNDEFEHEYSADDYSYIESFQNYDNNGQIYARAIEIYQQIPFRSILAIAEVDILRAAELRNYLGLPGQSLQSATAFRDKVVMKQLAKQHRILVPPFSRITRPAELLQFIRTYGYPVVMKPAIGVGSKDTYAIFNDRELETLLMQGLPANYMVESFVNGDLYHVDGVVADGKLVFCCASKYLHQPLQYSRMGYLGSYLLDQQNPLYQRLLTQTAHLLASFPTPTNTTFHAEWFYTPDDQIILCEIASRTGGGKIIEMIEAAYHIQMVQAFLQPQCQINMPFDQILNTPHKLAGWVKIPPKPGKFISAPTPILLPWVRDFQLLAEPGKEYHHPNGIGSYIASFVVDGATEQEVFEKLIYIAHWFNDHSQWAS